MAVVDQYHLTGAWNFRDVGSLRTDDGRQVQPGILYRSSELCSLDEGGRKKLRALSITDVIDLRSESEIAWNGPDVLPPGVTLHVASVHDEGQQTAPHESDRVLTTQLLEAALEHAYSRFPLLPTAQHALAYTIRVVSEASGGVLIHCAAGKDRSGWIVAALLRAAGVCESDILADYLRSNESVEPLRKRAIARNGDLSQLSDKILGVHHDFIAASWRAVDGQYGSFDAYLDQIGVDAPMIAALRRRLLR
ncbi:tyrosine-protein phosphatase [Mycobacterium sp. CBMA293]|uniref:tyrosine-protein phosphatase n=1 Tax=unclassified Mycolicibacterium TaxID=2636767 RepID=UPI0013224D42|nr:MULTISPECIES: tyrosine-protein phosphatase [unclassified Mycolicibacterium]MUL49007.1 tyrosine-protein phosphatase [Mycolicibacterium sp. CBMA 360]MUL93461.1 tyrosine-protein phosphatase [Mycolicibacterium sp. CBMA 230]MUM34673.1 tyrosine-protein phosphatase [Mycolicibacterium sp. CBMA 361]MUL58578.1 tyrosine-protein phosphatase [Mycolicibacterium sp. CBMA 335]MUL74036.1 tyrosine-protein phosphatase [Mycolicibacterium sp. CBMA 311]